MAQDTELRHIFISYRRREPDKEFAARLAEDLRAAGHPVWIDVEGIEGAETWTDEIQRAIDACYAYIIVVSPDSIASRWVRNELLYAFSEKVGSVYPVLFREVKLPLELRAIQYIDFLGDYDDAFARLLRDLPEPPIADPRPPEPFERIPAPRRRLPAWAWIGVAAAGVAVVIGGLALLGVFDGGAEPTLDLISTNPVVETEIAEPETAEERPIATLTIAATDIPTPTDTPLPADTPTSNPFIPVASNTAWEPFIQYFDGVPMALVPAGCFMMGSSEGEIDYAFDLCEQEEGECDRAWFEREAPQHEVCFEEPFWIDVYEVTNAEFAAFLNSEGNQTEGGVTWLDAGASDARIHESSGSWDADSSYEDHPAIQVTWYGAEAYCQWRTVRLPTEAEWEYTARGPDGLVFPWGDAFNCSLGNFDDETEYDSDVVEGGEGCDGFDVTAPVGSFPGGASWVGVYDLSGNVYEWVADWYGTYLGAAQVNPNGPSSGDRRMSRGGSWVNSPGYLRGAYRAMIPPDLSTDINGFRCALSYSD